MFYADKALLESIGQAVMGAYFVFQAGKNARDPKMVLGRLEGYRFPQPKLILWVGLSMMIGGGTLLLIDYWTSLGAVILFVFTLLATVIFQRWWTVADPVRRPYNFLMFCYNVFIMAAMLTLI
jgi:uncharacterized membrane protein YphA (DoxX/SURF4 family)